MDILIYEIFSLFLKTGLETLKFICPILLLIFISLFLCQIFIQLGLFKKLEPLGKIMTKLANLPPQIMVPFIVSLGSHVAANTILQNLRENQELTDREVLLGSILNSSIGPLRETFTYHLPIILPALGLKIGSFYILTLWFGNFLLFLFVVITGRILLPKRDYNKFIKLPENLFYEKIPKNFKNLLISAFKKILKIYKRISILFFTTTFLVFLLSNLGFFKKLGKLFFPIINWTHLSPKVIPALSTFIFSPIIGYASLGSLLQKGEIMDKEAFIALLIGSIFMLPIIYLRLYFPQWIAIFGLRLGLLRGIISLNLILFSRILVLIAFLTFIR